MAERFYIEPNDEPYLPYKVMDSHTNKLVLAYWQDDAPVHDFNSEQLQRAQAIKEYLNYQPILIQNIIVDLLKYSTSKV